MGLVNHYSDDGFYEALRVIEEVLRELGLHISCVLDLGLHTLTPTAQDVCTQHVECLLLCLRELLVIGNEMADNVPNQVLGLLSHIVEVVSHILDEPISQLRHESGLS
jgi:hypothetical protein